jgi:signal transduction histidine kinase
MPHSAHSPPIGQILTSPLPVAETREARVEALRRQHLEGSLSLDPSSIVEGILARREVDHDVASPPRRGGPPVPAPTAAPLAAAVTAALRAQAETQTSVLAGLAHDLASPLAATSSNLSVATELAAQLASSGGRAAADLQEVLDDLVAAAARLAGLCADLRAYGAMTTPPNTAAGLAETASRLARSHLSRRVRTILRVPHELRQAQPSPELTRTLCDALVALTSDTTSSPAGGCSADLTLVGDATGLRATLTPGHGSPGIRDRIAAALALSDVAYSVTEEDGSLVLQLSIRWCL